MLAMNATRSLGELSALYLLRCEVEGKSAQTVRAYGETLGRFRRTVSVADAAAVTPEDVYRYLGGFSHLSLETRHRYFREVRCFFNWLVDGRYLRDNPFRGIKNVRLPQRIVEPFSPADIAQLMAACDSATALGLRDRAMVLCLLDTGLRCSELVQLSLDDLDLDTRRLRVRHGKGNKQRVVPFAARCRAALKRYLEQRGTAPGPSEVAFGIEPLVLWRGWLIGTEVHLNGVGGIGRHDADQPERQAIEAWPVVSDSAFGHERRAAVLADPAEVLSVGSGRLKEHYAVRRVLDDDLRPADSPAVVHTDIAQHDVIAGWPACYRIPLRHARTLHGR